MTKWLLTAAFACAWPASALAGVRIESKVTVNTNPPVNSVLEVQGDRMRIDIKDPTGSALRSTIFDGTRMITLKPSDKTYILMTKADLDAQKEKMKAMLPPERRAELDKAVATPVFSFKRLSGGESAAGVSCEYYAVTRDGRDSGTACLSPWKHGPITKADLAPMKKLSDQMKSSGTNRAGDLQMGPQFDQWPGWPLIMRAPDGSERTRVVSFSRTTFPATDFEIPAGYTQVMLPSIGGAAHPTPSKQ
jgi:hypothetical protein